MNEQKFKTEYQLSENSVPVNTELKKKLMEMAKEYERSADLTPKITIPHTAKKKRIYKIAADISAIAACAAICAYAIPKINSQYFDRLSENEHITSTETPEAAASGGNTAGAVPQKAEDKPDAADGKNEAADIKPDAASGNTGAADSKPGAADNNRRNSRTGERYAAVNGAAKRAADPVKTDASKQEGSTVDTPNANNAVPPDNTRSREYETEPVNGTRIIYTPSEGGFEYSKSELDTRINTIEKNNRKLERWNDALVPYRSDDEIISGYYDSFSQSAAKYTEAAEDFELSYANVSDSGQVYEGIEKYDAELDGILFEACRSDYRKAKNYIEMNLTDYPENETQKSVETEKAESTETIERQEPDAVVETAEPETTEASVGAADSTGSAEPVEEGTEVSE